MPLEEAAIRFPCLLELELKRRDMFRYVADSCFP